jgi:hypothetical protein
MDYNIARNGQQLGTATEAQLRAGLSNGTYHATDLVWTEGMADWKTASDFFGLASPEPVAPAPAQAPFPAVRRPGPVAYAPPPAGSASSGLAVTSLVLGILSIIPCSVLTGLPAIITGHIARSKIKNSAGALGGGGMALAGLIMGYLSLAFVVFYLAVGASLAIPVFTKVQEKGLTVKSINNVRQLVTACRIYASENDGKYPADLELLFTQNVINERKILHCPLLKDDTQTGYDYFGAKLKDSDAGNLILFVSKWEDRLGKHIVGHNDGTVALEIPQE